MNSGLIAQDLNQLISTDFNKITVENGLSQNTVNCILKDSHGFVWFGTRSGLNRYNSYNVEQIRSFESLNDEFSNTEIRDLFEDNNSKIWIATISGLYYYDLDFETIKKCELFNEGMILNCILPENDSLLWIGTDEGLYLYKKLSGIQKIIKHSPYKNNSLSNSNVYSLLNDGNDLLVGTMNGLNKVNKSNYQITRLLHSMDPNSIGGNRIRSLSKSKDGTIWIGTEYNGLSKYIPENQSFVNYTSANSNLPHNYIRDICESSNNRLWLATNGGGLSLFDYKHEQFINYQHDPIIPGSLSNNSAYSVLEDTTGVLWVGTFADGINYTVVVPQTFQHIRYQPNHPNSIIESKIRSIFLDSKNNLWIGTWGGLSMIDSKSGKISSYSSNPENHNSLSFNTVTCIYEDSKKRIWIGTYSGGLNLFERDRNHFKHYKFNENKQYTISSNHIYCITEDHEHNLWIATNSGLNRFDEISNRFEVYNNYDVRDIAFDKNGDLLLALVGGVGKFEISSKSFDFYGFEPLSGYPLNYVNQSEDGKIWFGSQGGGMGYYNPDSANYKLFSVTDGLPSNHVCSAIRTSDSIFWISTYKGLSRYNIYQNKFKNFGLENGLPGYEFFPRSALKLGDGRLAFGSSKGLVFFNPDAVKSSTEHIPIMITGLKINNSEVPIGAKSILKKAIYNTKHITLNHSEKDFLIEYLAINYKSSGKNKYEYMLENYLDEWINAGVTRSISFTNLDPGDYVFRVRLMSQDRSSPGASSDQEATLNISIKPPFWGTWFFRSIILGLVITFVILYDKISLITKKQKKMLVLQKMEYEKQEKFVNMKLRFFSNISHEFKTPLTLIIDPILSLKKKKLDQESKNLVLLVERSSIRLQKLVDQILDFRKMEEEALELQVEEKDIIAAINHIFVSFNVTAQNQQIEYSFQSSVANHMGWFDEDKLEKILFNLLSNAFKFTPKKGKIEIFADLPNPEENKIEICVKDSGKGIFEANIYKIFDRFYTDQRASTVSRGGSGIGLALVKKLCDLHRGRITVESIKGIGTTFRVILPLDFKDYRDLQQNTSVLQNLSDRKNALDQIDLQVAEDIIYESGEKPKILVLEDDHDIKEYLTFTLSPHFNVISVTNGKEGVEILKQQTPDLILSDTSMSEMNGIEFCKIVKSDSKTSMIPFIFLSVWSSDDFKLKGLYTGATDYITKPFNSDVLIAKLKNTLALKSKYKTKAEELIDISPAESKIENIDLKFIEKVQQILEENLSDPEFNSTPFRKKMNMSHSLLYRKLKKLTGLSSNELIREYRLKRAAQILKANTGLNINEVALKVGYLDSKYFSHCFKKKHKLTPTEFLHQNSTNENSHPEQFSESFE